MPTTTTVDAETTVVTTETTQTAFGKEFNAPVTPRHLTLTNKKNHDSLVVVDTTRSSIGKNYNFGTKCVLTKT